MWRIKLILQGEWRKVATYRRLKRRRKAVLVPCGSVELLTKRMFTNGAKPDRARSTFVRCQHWWERVSWCAPRYIEPTFETWRSGCRHKFIGQKWGEEWKYWKKWYRWSTGENSWIQFRNGKTWQRQINHTRFQHLQDDRRIKWLFDDPAARIE